MDREYVGDVFWPILAIFRRRVGFTKAIGDTVNRWEFTFLKAKMHIFIINKAW
jgi:hypothetical protein